MTTSRPGAIAALSPVMAAVGGHAADGGRVLGICNGFQVLTEAGLLPGALRPTHPRFRCHDAMLGSSGSRLAPGGPAGDALTSR